MNKLAKVYKETQENFSAVNMRARGYVSVTDATLAMHHGSFIQPTQAGKSKTGKNQNICSKFRVLQEKYVLQHYLSIHDCSFSCERQLELCLSNI